MNKEGFKSELYSQLITTASGEADPAKRKQVYAQINDRLLDECFASVVSQFRPKLVTRSAVRGVEPTLHEVFACADTWLAS